VLRDKLVDLGLGQLGLSEPRIKGHKDNQIDQNRERSTEDPSRTGNQTHFEALYGEERKKERERKEIKE